MALTKITAAGLTADLIDETKLADNSIDSEHYNDGSIDNAHLADNAVDTDEIADDAVTLAKMDGLARGKLIVGDASGNPSALAAGSNDQVLTMDANGDVGWEAAAAGGISDVVSDTSPQLGGDLDTNSFEISLDNSHKVKFGANNDLEIWHTGSQGHIKNTTGDLRICGDTVFLRGEGDSEDYIKCWKDGAVKLFYNDVEKLATTATGVQVNGNLIIGSAGNGIDFSDTGDTGGMTNELLDDYEEGTWTPDFEELTVDAGNSYASYVKIGNLCQITCRIQCDGAGSSSSAVKITGLPFSRVSYHEIYFSPMLGKVDTDEGGYGPVCHGYSYGADKLIFERNNRLETGSNAYLTADICGDNATFQFTYVYRTA